MAIYAYQDIKYNLSLEWRSGPKPGHKFTGFDKITTWWNLSDSIIEASSGAVNENLDFSESRGAKKTLTFEDTATITVGTDATKDNLNNNTLILTDTEGTTVTFVIKGAQAAALDGVNIGLNNAANEDAISDALIAGINAHAIKITASDVSGGAADTAAHAITLTHDIKSATGNAGGGNMAVCDAEAGELAVTSGRSHASTETPSQSIATNSPKFGDHNKASITDASFNYTTGDDDLPFSVSFWARAVGANANARYVILKGPSNAFEYKVGFNSKAPIVQMRDAANQVISTEFSGNSAKLSETYWNHYVFTYDAKPAANRNGISLYVNGVKSAGTETNNASYSARAYLLTPLLVGDAVGNFNGWVSDLVFFNDVLDESSIKALYSAKDGIYIESRDYNKKGSSTFIESGGSMDPFREGVSVRHGEDLAISLRPKLNVGPSHRFYSGYTVMPGRVGSVELSFSAALDVGVRLTIKSTDGLIKTYLGITDNHGSIANGDIIAVDDNPGSAVGSGDPRIGMIAFHVGANGTDAALMLAEALNSTNGNNQGEANKKIQIVTSPGKIKLTQVKSGLRGNTKILVVSDSSNRITFGNEGFSGGTDSKSSRSRPAFDDANIPMMIRNAYASTVLTIAGGALDVNVLITIQSTDRTLRTYCGITENHATIKTGDIIDVGDNPDGGGAIADTADSRVGTIAFMVGADAPDATTNLKNAIDSANGHNGGTVTIQVTESRINSTTKLPESVLVDKEALRNERITVTPIGVLGSATTLVLKQAATGLDGNSRVVVTGDTSARITVRNQTATQSGRFTGGMGAIISADITGSRYQGVLDSSHRLGGYQSAMDHEIEQRDFGIFDGGYTGRHQDGTPFVDSMFDSPIKLLEPHYYPNVATPVYDRHLKPYIHSTPTELYNASEVYEKEARVDIFEEMIPLRSTIPDLRDAEKDFTRRSRRLVKSGSATIPVRVKGFSAESNCLSCVDVRYHDVREATLPFHEVHLHGDLDFGSPVQVQVGPNEYAMSITNSMRHEGTMRMEHILSQSSGPRKTSPRPPGLGFDATNIRIGGVYRTLSLHTDPTPSGTAPNTIGAANNSVGTIFTATGLATAGGYEVEPIDGHIELFRDPVFQKDNAPYGTYMESTVDTFYGLAGSHDKPPGVSFGVRYRTQSADRPFHDTTKEDHLETIISKKNREYANLSVEGKITMMLDFSIKEMQTYDVTAPMGHDATSLYQAQDSLYAFYKFEDPAIQIAESGLTDLSGNAVTLVPQPGYSDAAADNPSDDSATPGYGIKSSKSFANNLLVPLNTDVTAFRFTDGTTDSPFSVFMWIYLTSVGGSDAIARKGAVDSTEWVIYRTTDDIKVVFNELEDDTIGVVTTGNILTIDTWMQIVVTYNGNGSNTGIKIYAGGLEMNTSASAGGSYTAMTTSASGFSLGGSIQTDHATGEHLADGFSGKMAAFAVWSTALTAIEVAGLYQYRLSGDFNIHLPGKDYRKPLKKTYTLVDARTELMPGISSITTTGHIIRMGDIIAGKGVSSVDPRIGNIAVVFKTNPTVPVVRDEIKKAIDSTNGHNVGIPSSAIDVTNSEDVVATTDIKFTFNSDGGSSTHAAMHNVKITLISTDGTPKTYIGVLSGGDVDTGDILATGDNPDGDGVMLSNDPRREMIAYESHINGPHAIKQLSEAISSNNGHGNLFAVQEISVNNYDGDPDQGHIKLTQAVTGTAGNTTVTIAGDSSNLVLAPSFTGGSTTLSLSRHPIVPSFTHPITSSIPAITFRETAGSNVDMLAATRFLYMTGSSIHDGGLTGYNHMCGGFSMDPDGPRRDSITYLGLKRG